ncbi:MAG: LicD family protein [Chlamydiia bacterium]|nr:LicD family protein [Chlamydiia bacterium]
MSIIDTIPKICTYFPKLTTFFLNMGMGLVAFYHVYHESPFFNAAFEEAKGLEKMGNILLAPSHYLCEGKWIDSDFRARPRFDYETNKKIYSPLALSLFTPGTTLGVICKGFAFLSPEVKNRHLQFARHKKNQEIQCNSEMYRTLGMAINNWKEGERFVSQNHLRRPGSENHLKEDKKCLKEIVDLLTSANIPFWIDCGTCIGAYRYGGVIPWDNDLDISILAQDFQNAFHLLQKLDPKKYVAQDWSSRGRKDSYIRIYIKKSRSHIDLYTNEIDPENKTVTYVISHENSHFMANDWKERERRQKAPIPFDVIFPLKQGFFDGIAVPIPNQTERFLSYKYGPNLDPPRLYNAATDSYEKDLSHPYWSIPLAH